MNALLKSEYRKLVTARSTYVLIAISLLMTAVFAFWGAGIRATPESLNDPAKLSDQIIGAVGAVPLVVALIGVLLMTHEYRYNTIAYTLTASNSRAKTLLAKIIILSCTSVVLTISFAIISPLLTKLGLAIKGYELVPQIIDFQSLWWRCLFYGWGYMMFGLLLAVLLRSQVVAIITLLMAQSTVEPLLGLLLKNNAVYLPFGALNSVLSENVQISSAKAILVVALYMIISGAAAFALFIRRDA